MFHFEIFLKMMMVCPLQFQLVCDKAWLVDMVSSIQSFGKLIAAFTAGWFSDR